MKETVKTIAIVVLVLCVVFGGYVGYLFGSMYNFQNALLKEVATMAYRDNADSCQKALVAGEVIQRAGTP